MPLSISSAHVGHYDLATFDKHSEMMMYGTADADATDYFVRDVRRCILFSQIPVSLTKQTGEADFGGEATFVVNRGGDYMTYTWLRVKLPEVKLSAKNEYAAKGSIRWCKNFMHNLVAECNLMFSESRGARFDSFFLDFWSAFTVPASKRASYAGMIGNSDAITCPSTTTLPSVYLNLPLPLFYSRDTGVALPISAIAYNEVKLVFRFRRWQELLILDSSDPMTQAISSYTIQDKDVEAVPKLDEVGVFANYILINAQDRARIGCEPRVVLIEQVQTAPIMPFTPLEGTSITTNVRFSFGVKCLFFGVRNRSRPAEWSNYTTHSPTILTSAAGRKYVNYMPEGHADPIGNVSLTYDNSTRLQEVGADYFSMINPYFHAPAIPDMTGYHLYSYALDFWNADPTGSTNFSRIPSVDITIKPTQICVDQTTPAKFQKFELIVISLVQNIMKITGGGVIFPIH